jgi:hypothetical protein
LLWNTRDRRIIIIVEGIYNPEKMKGNIYVIYIEIKKTDRANNIRDM